MREKMSKQPPSAPAASAVGPCPTVIQIVGRPGTGSLPSTIAPPDHPLLKIKYLYFYIFFYVFYLNSYLQHITHTFISVNHIICNIGCLKQTGKRMLQLS